MYLPRIAIRNLKRRPWRTVVTASVLAVAVISFLLLDTFMGGLMELSFDNIVDFESSHVIVGKESFLDDDDRPLEELFTPTDDVMAQVSDLAGFVAMTPVLDFLATINVGGDEFPLMIRAIDEDSFKKVFRTQEYVVDGGFVAAGNAGLVIGNQLAELLRLEVGDFYTLLFRDRRGSFNTIEGQINGVLATPHPAMNLSIAFIALEDTWGALGVETEEISQLMVRFRGRSQAHEQAAVLRHRLASADYGVRSYRDASQMLMAMEAWAQLETWVILGLILLVGGVGIVNVVILSALERTEEIGMMKAMGLKDGEIVRVFVLEAGGIGLVGGLMGCAVGAVGVAVFAHFGLPLDALFGGAELAMGIPILGRMYGIWNPSSFVVIFCFAVLVALVSSIVPSYWAARKDPIAAIQHR